MCLQRPSSVTSAGYGLKRQPGRVALVGSEGIDENGGGPGCRYESRTKRGKRTGSAGHRDSATKDGGDRHWRLGPGLATTDTDPCARAFRVVCNLATASYMPR